MLQNWTWSWCKWPKSYGNDRFRLWMLWLVSWSFRLAWLYLYCDSTVASFCNGDDKQHQLQEQQGYRRTTGMTGTGTRGKTKGIARNTTFPLVKTMEIETPFQICCYWSNNREIMNHEQKQNGKKLWERLWPPSEKNKEHKSSQSAANTARTRNFSCKILW